MPVVEMRSYRLVPGSRERFHQLVSQRSLPLMLDWGMDVLDYGPSLHDADSYFLMRAFDDLAHRQTAQATFYASPAWRNGPREAIVGLIASDSQVVMELSADRVQALRKCGAPALGAPSATAVGVAGGRVVAVPPLPLNYPNWVRLYPFWVRLTLMSQDVV